MSETNHEPDDAAEDARNFAEDAPDGGKRGRGPTRPAVRMADLMEEMECVGFGICADVVEDGKTRAVFEGDIARAEEDITHAEATISNARDLIAQSKISMRLFEKFAALPPHLQRLIRAAVEAREPPTAGENVAPGDAAGGAA